jgi:hypothetical protein
MLVIELFRNRIMTKTGLSKTQMLNLRNKPMEALFVNDYQAIYYYEDLGALEQRFTAKSTRISGDTYMDEMRIFNRLIEANQTEDKKINKLIINILAGGPTMEPKVQEWMHRYFYQQIAKMGIKYKAYCVGEEILANLSIELTAEDDPNDLFKYKYFESLKDGLAWLELVVPKLHESN